MASNEDATVEVASHEDLKAAIRARGLTQQDRERLWPILPQVPRGSPPRRYPDVVRSAERLLRILPAATISNYHSLTADQRHAQLALTLAGAKGHDCFVVVTAFLRVLTATIPRFDVSYYIAMDVLDNSIRNLPQSVQSLRQLTHAFRRTATRCIPQTAATLERLGALDDLYLGLMFLDWFRSVLPWDSVLRVMDGFLLEGEKIFFRYGIAIIVGYKAAVKQGAFSTADAFWARVQQDASSNGGAGTAYLAHDVHRSAFDVNRSRLQKLRRPLAVSRANLSRFKAEVAPSSVAPLTRPYFPPNLPVCPDNSGDFELPSRDAETGHVAEGVGSQNRSTTGGGGGGGTRVSSRQPQQYQDLAAKTSTVTSLPPPPLSSKESVASTAAVTAGRLSPRGRTSPRTLAHDSTILDERKAAQLLLLLESTLQSCDAERRASFTAQPKDSTVLSSLSSGALQFDLLFSAAVDGYNLQTLYAKVAECSDLLVLVKSLSANQTIVGAYCDASFARPSRSARGSLNTFVFTVGGVDSMSSGAVYVAVGDEKEKTGEDAAVAHSGGGADAELLAENNARLAAEARLRQRSTRLQYCVAAPEYLCFGASSEHGTNALRIDGELRTCKFCCTFLSRATATTHHRPMIVLQARADRRTRMGMGQAL